MPGAGDRPGRARRRPAVARTPGWRGVDQRQRAKVSADAQSFIDALGRLEADGDPEPLVALFAQDSVCDNVTPATSFEGPDGARTFWKQDRALFDRVRSEFHNVISTDDRVALEWTREGSARNGSPVRFEGVSILELHDGHITRFKAYFGPHQVGRQTG